MSRIVVVGAGAIGGLAGGLLIEAGEEVVLVARSAHGRAIAERGLTLRTAAATRTVRPAAVVEDAGELEGRPGDLVLLCVKSQDSEPVLRTLAGVLHDDATIACLQNGLENERAALRRFASVLAVCVMVPSVHTEPGEVTAFSAPVPGILDVGPAAPGARGDAAAVASRLAAAGFDSVAREDVLAWKRAKLLLNLANAAPALDGGRELVAAAREEGRAVYAAAGLEWIDDATWERRRDGVITPVDEVDGVRRTGSSTIQSLQRGAAEVETDFLNGEVVLLGRLHGVPTPANAEICARMRRQISAG